MPTQLLIKNCQVLQFMDDIPVISDGQDIWIVDNHIKSVGARLQVNGPELTEIDAAGMLAIPGLMNTHAHVPMVLFRNAGPDVNADDWFNKVIFPLEANLTPEDVYWGAMLGLAEMIEAGITSVADHYFYMDSVARAVEQAGLRANLVWAVFGHEGYAKLDETVAFVERWQGKANGRITTWLGPHSPYLCDPDFLCRCADLAGQLHVGTHIHVSETREQVELSFNRYGKSPVRVLADTGILEQPCILAHCLYPSEEDLDLLAGQPCGIAQATKTYLTLAMGLPDLEKYLARGIPLGLATDGAVSSCNLDILEQMRLLAMTQKHHDHDATKMNEDQILRVAFQGSAKVLREPRLGSLVEGALADVVLLKTNRASNFPAINAKAGLVYNLNAGDVDTVICDGRVLYQHQRHLTLDKAEIYREVSARLPRLLRKDLYHKIADYPS